MHGIGIVCLVFILTSICPEVWSDGVLPIRLNGGSSPHQGRIEVFHDGEWGTVCDDGFTNKVCNVLCKQLGYGSESMCISEEKEDNDCQTNDGTVFAMSTARIWIDELKCEGSESSIDECRKTNWGETNCGHKEDAGCICNQTTKVTAGWCDKSRHRIAPFERSNPIMGRVEIQDENNNWGLVCDDDWDDIDASVFCDCLGYKGRHSFRALLYPNHNSSLPMLYNAVHCKPQDTMSTKNLWDCDVVKADNGQCDPNKEAAGVVCASQPAWVSPVIPNVVLSCDGQWLSGCFEPESDVSADHLFLTPSCSNSSINRRVDGAVCVRIDMSTCEASHTKTNVSTKHYCHDITFSRYGNGSVELLTESVWTRRLCCIATKNGTALGSFLPQMVAPPAIYKENSEVNNFTMTCYQGEAEDSEALEFPASVQRGEPVSCYIGVRTWDTKLNMIVSDCKFMTAVDNSGPHFYFFRHKCPTTDDLGLIFYNTDHRRWGFRFNVPKFQTYDELYLSCDIYLCDMTQETKPHCDRSCASTHNAGMNIGPVKRRVGKRGFPSRNSVSSMLEKGHIEHGPFLVVDDGIGPLINDLGKLVVVAAANRSVILDVSQERGSLYNMGELGNAIPIMQIGQATQVVASLWIIASVNLLI